VPLTRTHRTPPLPLRHRKTTSTPHPFPSSSSPALLPFCLLVAPPAGRFGAAPPLCLHPIRHLGAKPQPGCYDIGMMPQRFCRIFPFTLLLAHDARWFCHYTATLLPGSSIQSFLSTATIRVFPLHCSSESFHSTATIRVFPPTVLVAPYDQRSTALAISPTRQPASFHGLSIRICHVCQHTAAITSPATIYPWHTICIDAQLLPWLILPPSPFYRITTPSVPFASPPRLHTICIDA
jgi:hypothetical protein